MIALDLFAGTGWGVACQRLGIEEYGVEIMPEARAVRAANGMKTWYADVWQGLEADVRRFDSAAFFDIYDLLIASPPCQTFSMAGGGAGRRALDDVLGLIDSRAYLNVEALRAFGEAHDPRTALVLTPLAYVARDVPLHVVLEQVPPVLPVWERYAVEMRKWGYSVWTGIVHAEQHGVPQTRKRAILIARADGVEAAPPTPTHSKYYPRDPERLDPGVAPWVSMAEALGRSAEGGTYFHPMTYDRREVWPNAEPAPTVRGVQRDMPDNYKPHPRDAMRSNYGTGGDPANRGERETSSPSATVTSKADRNTWVRQPAHSQQNGISDRLSAVPALTVTSDTGGLKYIDEAEASDRARELYRELNLDPDLPATTVAADPRLSSRDHHEHGAQAARSTRVTLEEAAALQSYPPDFVWDAEIVDPRSGKLKPITKTKKFLQVGNAVPPLMAEAILRAAIEGSES